MGVRVSLKNPMLIKDFRTTPKPALTAQAIDNSLRLIARVMKIPYAIYPTIIKADGMALVKLEDNFIELVTFTSLSVAARNGISGHILWSPFDKGIIPIGTVSVAFAILHLAKMHGWVPKLSEKPAPLSFGMFLKIKFMCNKIL